MEFRSYKYAIGRRKASERQDIGPNAGTRFQTSGRDYAKNADDGRHQIK